LKLASLTQELMALTEKNRQRQQDNQSHRLSEESSVDPFFRLGSGFGRASFAAVRPGPFIDSLRQSGSIFAGTTQQDAQEFFKYILSCFQEAASVIPEAMDVDMGNGPSTRPRGNIHIENLFQGTLVRCHLFLDHHQQQHPPTHTHTHKNRKILSDALNVRQNRRRRRAFLTSVSRLRNRSR